MWPRSSVKPPGNSRKAGPVAGISVVTEAVDFGGSLDMVRHVAALVDAPILRYREGETRDLVGQLYHARRIGRHARIHHGRR